MYIAETSHYTIICQNPHDISSIGDIIYKEWWYYTEDMSSNYQQMF